METEAWFLAEHTHFRKLNSNLTSERIKAEFGFDPSVDDMQLRSCPSDDLHSIYQLEGLSYRKRQKQVQKTVRHLDYGIVYLELIDRFPDLRLLVQALDIFFT